MSETWQPRRLGEFISVKHGWAFPAEEFRDEGDYIVLTPGNFVEGGGLKLRGTKDKHYSADFPEHYMLSEKDILVVMTDLIQSAPLLGGALIVPEDNRFLHNQRLGLVQTEGKEPVDRGFLYYLLNSPDYKAQVRASATGATVRHTAPTRIESCNVTVPNDLAEQRAIAETLEWHDAAIFQTSRQIELLEEAARLIYTEWFVRLRFPGHKQARTGTHELPSGWQATSIGTVTSYLNRGVAPSYDDSSPKRVINQKCIRDRQLSMEQARNLANEISSEKWLQKGDVLINSTGTGTLGRVAQVREELDSVTVDTHVTIVRPRTEIPPWFFGQQLLRMEALFESLGEGATNQTELKRDRIRDTSFLLPSPQIMAAFDEKVEPMIEQIEVLRKQIAQLRQARDLLLPRLISGQLRL